MSRTSALLLLTLLAHVSCAGIRLADEPLASFKGRWKLELLFQKGQSHGSLDNTIQSRFVGDGVFLQKPSKKNPTE